jgi:aspartate aminotransferase-like enzyme
MDKGVIRLIPGPVSVSRAVSKAFAFNYPSPDLDAEFFELYGQTEAKLNKVLGASGSVIMQTGEGMLGLWGALKSCLLPGDKLYAICNGVFGDGIADMGEAIGAEVKRYAHPYDCTNFDYAQIEQDISQFKPKMITLVHCETPSGLLNPLDKIGELKAKYGVPLLCVDSVASAGGAPVDVDRCHVDLSLNGSQKCFSAPPDLTMVTVNDAAWQIIEAVNYKGYDAFFPFKNALKNQYFPNTLSWHSIAAVAASVDMLLEEGLEQVYARHCEAQAHCIKRIEDMGLRVYAKAEAHRSPTVTAVYLPEGASFEALNKACLEAGVAIAGSYGPLSGKIFRIGHMGTQADIKLLGLGLDRLAQVLAKEFKQ